MKMAQKKKNILYKKKKYHSSTKTEIFLLSLKVFKSSFIKAILVQLMVMMHLNIKYFLESEQDCS